MKTTTDIKNILMPMRMCTEDLTCVTYLLLSETMHLLQVQPGRGGRREVFKITGTIFAKREWLRMAALARSSY